jgi:DNA-binding MarR family transcriptional regulator
VSEQAPGPLTEAGLDRVTAMNHLLKLTNRLMAPFSTHLEKRYRISLNEFRVLMVIGQMGVTASHELAQILGVNTMAVSRAVAALNRHGRIDVATDPLSRRRKTLQLTAEGERLWREMMPASVKVADYLFEALRADEVMAFDHYVRTLTERLEAQDPRGRSVFLERTKPGEDPA